MKLNSSMLGDLDIREGVLVSESFCLTKKMYA